MAILHTITADAADKTLTLLELQAFVAKVAQYDPDARSVPTVGGVIAGGGRPRARTI